MDLGFNYLLVLISKDYLDLEGRSMILFWEVSLRMVGFGEKEVLIWE